MRKGPHFDMIRRSLPSHVGLGSAVRNFSTELMSSNSTNTEF